MLFSFCRGVSCLERPSKCSLEWGSMNIWTHFTSNLQSVAIKPTPPSTSNAPVILQKRGGSIKGACSTAIEVTCVRGLPRGCKRSSQGLCQDDGEWSDLYSLIRDALARLLCIFSAHPLFCWSKAPTRPKAGPRSSATSMHARWWWMPLAPRWGLGEWTSSLWTAEVGAMTKVLT